MNPKLRALLAVGAELSRGIGLRGKIRQAREDNDRLVMADAIVTVLGLITGVALAVREVRKAERE
ncbi:hypothetical protein J2S53_000154 [Actinopolyspora lacussalsi]|uniref:Uncharacterized protein n=2 Tax=Actinopolyspora alba group TaxID=2893675 RepID=A0A1I2B2B3_9ACTN|nr:MULTISPECIES: hypothetical protein [Actinopolyspora alba group]MDP9640209.1 hypothetical protein [Actinopolyspora lacussalsi]SFE50304.1 hypothetical protein SAMN04487819_11535 [Actinopolyspora alba]SFT95093.1 hypothetical protein SAMN04487904_11521 [Actinopolyspora righensis]